MRSTVSAGDQHHALDETRRSQRVVLGRAPLGSGLSELIGALRKIPHPTLRKIAHPRRRTCRYHPIPSRLRRSLRKITHGVRFRTVLVEFAPPEVEIVPPPERGVRFRTVLGTVPGPGLGICRQLVRRSLVSGRCVGFLGVGLGICRGLVGTSGGGASGVASATASRGPAASLPAGRMRRTLTWLDRPAAPARTRSRVPPTRRRCRPVVPARHRPLGRRKPTPDAILRVVLVREGGALDRHGTRLARLDRLPPVRPGRPLVKPPGRVGADTRRPRPPGRHLDAGPDRPERVTHQPRDEPAVAVVGQQVGQHRSGQLFELLRGQHPPRPRLGVSRPPQAYGTAGRHPAIPDRLRRSQRRQIASGSHGASGTSSNDSNSSSRSDSHSPCCSAHA